MMGKRGKISKYLFQFKNDIFDVSDNRDMYGPQGSYKWFSGKETSVAMARNSVKSVEVERDWYSTQLNQDEKVWKFEYSNGFNID